MGVIDLPRLLLEQRNQFFDRLNRQARIHDEHERRSEDERTGCRSFSVSNGMDLNSVGLEASELGAASSVSPSGSALATSPAAIMPLAPALFSTTTALPSRGCILAATARMMTSVLAPGGKATRNLTGPEGKSSARAMELKRARSRRAPRLQALIVASARQSPLTYGSISLRAQ